MSYYIFTQSGQELRGSMIVFFFKIDKLSNNVQRNLYSNLITRENFYMSQVNWVIF